MLHRSKHHNWRSRVFIVLAELAGVLDALVVICSLTTLTSDFRASVLFSDTLEDWLG